MERRLSNLNNFAHLENDKDYFNIKPCKLSYMNMNDKLE